MERRPTIYERTAVFLLTLIVVIFVLLQMRVWQGDLWTYFLQAEKWPELIFLFAITYIISTVLQMLLQWNFRIESTGGRIRRR
jgi:hypothetical protein